jgi:hypothetical protein
MLTELLDSLDIIRGVFPAVVHQPRTNFSPIILRMLIITRLVFLFDEFSSSLSPSFIDSLPALEHHMKYAERQQGDADHSDRY